MTGTDVNVLAVTDDAQDSGVAAGAELLAFADAVMQGDDEELTTARDALRSTLGDDAVVDTAAVIAMFNVVDRIADATGIPIDEGIAHDGRYRIGEALGMEHLTPEQRARN